RASRASCRVVWPVVAPLQICCMSRSPRGSNSCESLAHPCSRASRLIQIRWWWSGMGMADSPAGRGIVDCDFPVQVHGHLCGRRHVHGDERLAIQLVDPGTDIADAAAEDAVHSAVAGAAGNAQRAVGVTEQAAAVFFAVEQRGHPGARRGEQALGTQLLLGVRAPLPPDAPNTLRIGQITQTAAQALAVAAGRTLITAGDGVRRWHAADGAVLKYEGD